MCRTAHLSLCSRQSLISLPPSLNQPSIKRDPILFAFIVEDESLGHFAAQDDDVGRCVVEARQVIGMCVCQEVELGYGEAWRRGLGEAVDSNRRKFGDVSVCYRKSWDESSF